MPKPALKLNETVFAVRDYDLAATLGCGQAFRWELRDGCWQGVVGVNAVALEQRTHSRPLKFVTAEVSLRDSTESTERKVSADSRPRLQFTCSSRVPPHPNPLPLGGGEGEIRATASQPQTNWRWLEDYLQIHMDLPAILATFPQDAPMRQAAVLCRGLRLLRQEPWECLASFILSSTKQIVQIRQIIAQLCARHGRPITAPDGTAAFTFPPPEQIAALNESQLRECKMGFRAPYLLAAARSVADGELDLSSLGRLDLPEARAQLVKLPGVGPKIADCVLLFACGFPSAFPVDVWVMRALRQAYFRNRRVPLARLRNFSATHFGPHGGYAQQYLFHSLRLGAGKKLSQ